MVTLFTDGACSGNPGPGGWAAIVDDNGSRREVTGAEPATTNNRMELMAVIGGLESLEAGTDVRVVTDSQYVVKGITEWIHGWIRKRWKGASGKTVKNRDLWERLYSLTQIHRVEWEWVKGHDGHPENELADALAREAISGLNS